MILIFFFPPFLLVALKTSKQHVMLDHRKISHNFCLQAAESVVRMFVDCNAMDYY